MEEFRDHTGEIRMLARLEPTSDSKLMRAARTSFVDYLAERGKSLIPRSEWKPIRRRKTLGTQFINNQGQFGACVGFSAAQAFMRLRAMRGLSFQKLSGAFIYAHVNHGVDQGAIITDAMTALESYGTCLESEFNVPHIYLTQLTPQAKQTANRFKLREGLTLGSFDEIGTAIQMGFMVQHPVRVGPNFQRFTGDFVAGFDRGPGNHSVHDDGMDFIGNEWVFDMPNSWGLGWADQGRCYLTEAHIAGAGAEDDAYCHIDMQDDPQDSQNPPEIAA